MSTQLTPARHLEGFRSATVAFVRYADRAGLDAPVPTCAGWTVRDLVAHQGAAYRSTAALLRSEAPGPTATMSGDPIEWLRDGAIELVEAITGTPQGSWARRACHQATIGAVDALAAVFGRAPEPAETWIETDLAVDGIDEVLTEIARRPGSRLRSDEDAVLVVAPDDVPDWWLVRVGPRAPRTERRLRPLAEIPRPDWELHGPAVRLYLALWDRCARPMSRGGWPGPPEVGLAPASRS